MSEVEVSYGDYELDETQPTSFDIVRNRAGVPVRLEPRPRLRRKRFETWTDEHGGRMGRWDWETVYR